MPKYSFTYKTEITADTFIKARNELRKRLSGVQTFKVKGDKRIKTLYIVPYAKKIK